MPDSLYITFSFMLLVAIVVGILIYLQDHPRKKSK